MESYICHSGGAGDNTFNLTVHDMQQQGFTFANRGVGGWGSLPSLFISCSSRGRKHSQLLHTTGYTGSPEVKPVRTPVAILGSLAVCIYVPASRHWLISYSPIHLI